MASHRDVHHKSAGNVAEHIDKCEESDEESAESYWEEGMLCEVPSLTVLKTCVNATNSAAALLRFEVCVQTQGGRKRTRRRRAEPMQNRNSLHPGVAPKVTMRGF